jgi:hypothetical protein
MKRNPTRYLASLLAAATLAMGIAATRLHSQRRMFVEPNAVYDGRYTFVRLRYTVGRASGWEFDYPAMERNFMTIVNELTTMRPHITESNIHTMDDPALTKYAVAYLSEPGYWIPNEREAAGLRDWLAKGGFLIVDDFYFSQWQNFERSMRMVLPHVRFVRLTVSHPIFDTFFTIKTLEGMTHPDNDNAHAEYYGVFEDNDPSKRMLAIVNYNNDIGDYMEWSGQGWYQVNLSNDAYKLATNYIVWGLTH